MTFSVGGFSANSRQSAEAAGLSAASVTPSLGCFWFLVFSKGRAILSVASQGNWMIDVVVFVAVVVAICLFTLFLLIL